MELAVLLLLTVVAIALVFDFTNGFHDSANAIATVVATKALSMRQALAMAAVMNLCGAFFATAVAKTIEEGLIRDIGDPLTSQFFVLAALLGAISWNVLTWWLGMPSSSSHAIVGGLVGAGIVYGHRSDVIWSGVINKVLIPMAVSPVVGALVAVVVMLGVFYLFRPMHPNYRRDLFRRMQIGAGALMAFSHGSNDAQKTMGVITLALVGAKFLPAGSDIPWWVIVLCAGAMAGGTWVGGKRIITTAGEKITKLEQESGFAANIAGSLVIFGASNLGMPVSTTHVVIGSITGAGGISHFLRHKWHHKDKETTVTVTAEVEAPLEGPVQWNVWRSMVLAWVLTLPGAGLAGGLLFYLFKQLFLA
jgi:PiT family inorganic phosphate transporter